MITIGTRVAIMPGADYGNSFAGCVGIVIKNSPNFNKVGVRVEGCGNPNSEYGVFWFDERCLAVMPDSILVGDAIKQIIFSGPKTIVIWKDGSKTIASCGEGDTFDRYAGFCACVTKKMFGSTSKIKKLLEKHTKEVK